MQAQHHADDPSTARVGLIRGVLVIVTAIAVGAFVLSRGGFSDGSIDAVASNSIPEGSEEGSLDGAGEAGADSEDDSASVAEGATDPAADPTTADPATEPALTDPGDAMEEGTETTATTVAGAETSLTTVDPAGPAATPAEVQVLVLNAEGTKGVAGRGSEVLSTAGYDVLAPKNATVLAGSSAILYAGASDADALAIAAAFGADAALVAPLDPAAPPINDIGAADVVVVIGQDGALGV